MTEVMKKITVSIAKESQANVFFDPHVFELLTPRLSAEEEKHVLAEAAHAAIRSSFPCVDIYITRLFRDDFAAFSKNEGDKATIKALMTSANGPALEIRELSLAASTRNHPSIELPYQTIAEVPESFDQVKHVHFIKNTLKNNECINNENRRIQGIKKVISNALYTSNFFPISSFSLAPAPALTMTDDTIFKNPNLLDQRFGLKENTISTLLQTAAEKKTNYDQEIAALHLQYIDDIENNIEQLQLENDSSFTDANLEKLKSYAQQLKNSLIEMYLPKKMLFLTELYNPNSEAYEISLALGKMRTKIKNAVKEAQYGITIEQLTYIKHYLIWALYNTGFAYLQENWEAADKIQKDDASIIKHRQTSIQFVNQTFKNIIYVDELGRISPLSQAYTQLETLSLEQLRENAQQILIACNKKIAVNSEPLKYALNAIKTVNLASQQVLGFDAFKIPNTLTDKTCIYLSNEIKQFSEKAQEQIDTVTNKLEALNTGLNASISAKSSVSLSLQKDLNNINVKAFQAIENVKTCKRIYLEIQAAQESSFKINNNNQDYAQILQKAQQFLSRFSLVNTGENNDVVQPIAIINRIGGNYTRPLWLEINDKIILMQKYIKKIASKLQHDNKLLDAKHQELDFLIEGLLNEANLTEHHVKQVKKLSMQWVALEKNQALCKKELDLVTSDIYKLEKIFKIPASCDELTVQAEEFVGANNDAKSPINANKIYQINHFYNELTFQLEKYKSNIIAISLPQLKANLCRYIEQSLVKVQHAQNTHNNLLLCHLIANDLLHLQKWKSSFNYQRAYQQHTSYKIHPSVMNLLRLLLEDEAYQGWERDARKAEQLLLAWQENTKQSPPFKSNSQNLYSILVNMPIPPSQDFLSQLIINNSATDHSVFLSQHELRNIKLAPRPSTDSLLTPPEKTLNIPTTKSKLESDSKGFFSRNWKKILLVALVAGLIIGGIFTYGILGTFTACTSLGLVAAKGAASFSLLKVLGASIGLSGVALAIGTVLGNTLGYIRHAKPAKPSKDILEMDEFENQHAIATHSSTHITKRLYKNYRHLKNKVHPELMASSGIETKRRRLHNNFFNQNTRLEMHSPVQTIENGNQLTGMSVTCMKT